MTVTYITQQAELTKILPRIFAKDLWAMDTETTGLDPHKDKVILLQLGDADEQFVIDTRKVNIAQLFPVLMSEAVRKVGHNGEVSFAGADYRVGNAYRGRQVEVTLAGDTLQIWGEGRLLRTHQAKHDRRKEHGAFAHPGGRPDRTNAA